MAKSRKAGKGTPPPKGSLKTKAKNWGSSRNRKRGSKHAGISTMNYGSQRGK